MKCSYFLLLLMLCWSVSFSQRWIDYAVSNKGDTTFGEIFTKTTNPKIRVNNQFVKLNPANYKTLRLSAPRQTFRSIAAAMTLTKKTWVLCIEEGAIKLYQHIRPGHVQPAYLVGAVATGLINKAIGHTFWYASKDDSMYFKIKSDGLSGGDKGKNERLYELFSDNPGLLADFKAEKDFSFITVANYIHRYNSEAKAKANSTVPVN